MAKDTIARALAIHAMSEPIIPLAGEGIDVSGGKINVKYDVLYFLYWYTTKNRLW